jgi:hypothetical protein
MAVSSGTVTVTKPKPTGGNPAMLLQIITLYCVCDDYLLQSGQADSPQVQMSTAEVMTTALVAAWFFAGNLRLACGFLKEGGYIPRMLSESRFNRRLHHLRQAVWQGVFAALTAACPHATYVVDSYPLRVCQKARALRRRLYADPNAGRAGDPYRGYCAAQEEWFYGLKAHVVIAANGRPVQVLLLCGCSADLTGLKEMALSLPNGAVLYADKAYNDYGYEQHLQDTQNLTLLPLRKSNSKRPHPVEVTEQIRRVRKRIETTFSQIHAKLARRIAAVTEAGFESKVMALFVAYAILGVAS